MELKSINSGPTAKLTILKLGEYKMWAIRIKQYFQIQDYALWEVIENEEKTKKKNDVKAWGLLLMLPKNQNSLEVNSNENFSATSAESLDSIFNRLQKIVSRLAILGVIIAQEDLNLKILSSLPPEWNTHVVVWMNKPEIETMSIDDLYNNFKIPKQKPICLNTASSQVSAASPSVNTVSPQDLEQIHEDDLEAMDLKWQLSLLSVRAKKYYQKTGKKIFINGNDIAGYDKSKVECYNCHKLGHFAREYRAPRSKEKKNDQIRKSRHPHKQGNIEDTSKAMLDIDGVGFNWSDMVEEQVQTNMARMAFSDSEAITYKRGLDTVEAQLVTYKKNEVLFSEEVVVLKREVGIKQYEINTLKTEFEKLKQEKDAIDFKIEKFVPPSHPLIYNRPNKLDLSYSDLDEFKEPEFKGYGPENKQESQVKSSFVKGCGSNTSKFVKKHMTGNIAYLSDFKQFDGSYIAFGGGAYGGKILGKGTLKTTNLDFEDILLKVPRKYNMYSFDMKNIVPKECLTYFVAKATLDESMLWHRRLGHINFKNINNLVKDNLVRGLPTKRFENDQTYVACLKGKQHRASCKSKVLNPINKPLFMLHIDLFGPTFVSSLMHKKYCLVVTDDYSRTPQQNGVAERRNKTLIKAARTMLADSKLPSTI
ncbi:putative ribonuclease H-like domain-containing protein [Tanacetum coccineum]